MKQKRKEGGGKKEKRKGEWWAGESDATILSLFRIATCTAQTHTFGAERHDKCLAIERLSHARLDCRRNALLVAGVDFGIGACFRVDLQRRLSTLRQKRNEALDREVGSRGERRRKREVDRRACRCAKNPTPRSWMPRARVQSEAVTAAVIGNSTNQPNRSIDRSIDRSIKRSRMTTPSPQHLHQSQQEQQQSL